MCMQMQNAKCTMHWLGDLSIEGFGGTGRDWGRILAVVNVTDVEQKQKNNRTRKKGGGAKRGGWALKLRMLDFIV